MSNPETLPTSPMLPYDSDGQLIEVIWKRLSTAMQRGAKDVPPDAGNGRTAGDPVAQLSPAELQALLLALQDRLRTTQHLITRLEAILKAAGH